jgi:hypothetical protein
VQGELPRVAFGSLGENPSGNAGGGQEMFGIAEYQSGLETRDIMWKKAAKMAQESTRLPMRVREGSTKKLVKVGLAVGSSETKVERELVIDKVAEALAQLGKDLLLIGPVLEVVYAIEGSTRSATAATQTELAELVIGQWIQSDGTTDPRELFGSVDLLILESDSPDEVRLLTETGPTPLLVVYGAARHVRMPSRAIVFTGEEDLTELAGLVLAT